MSHAFPGIPATPIATIEDLRSVITIAWVDARKPSIAFPSWVGHRAVYRFASQRAIAALVGCLLTVIINLALRGGVK